MNLWFVIKTRRKLYRMQRIRCTRRCPNGLFILWSRGRTLLLPLELCSAPLRPYLGHDSQTAMIGRQ
uniref:Uncharacterized protein n=1 Tax=Utricularia reniformis TaxID=192314 RepID=A0A1Y0B2I4_9LAMI|nr:hypothetical protein AEK19_MT1475 [Utricularia reniformis]ART31665.1 hypothetical protein AEK19_MT1475 [Utricularia reniformis]